MKHLKLASIIVGSLALGTALALAQRGFSKVEIKTTQVADHIYELQGAGGNIGVFTGEDGALLIDDQFAPLSEKIKAAVAAVSDKPIRFILNTHWHGDHTGGNENFAKAGISIVAHENVRRRMSTEQYNSIFDRKTSPSPALALPILTFSDSVTFHLNGEDVTCFHVPAAHTDGDVIVWFRKPNVVHMGDCLFNGIYPVIDVSTGGSTSGLISAANQVLANIGPETQLIPGHGPLAKRRDLEVFRDMLVTARERVKKLIEAKKSIEEIQKAKPLADLDATWGKGSITPDLFLKELHADLSRAGQ